MISRIKGLFTRQAGSAPLRIRWARVALLVVAIGLVAGVVVVGKGQGYRTRLMRALGLQTAPLPRPVVVKSKPYSGQVKVPVQTAISVDVKIHGSALKAKTINNQSVVLVRTRDWAKVETKVQPGKAGFIVTPLKPLEPNCEYTLHMTDQVHDVVGSALRPNRIEFSTAGQPDPNIKFERVKLKNATGAGFTSVVVGPDHKLYAGVDDGRLFRFAINADGTLEPPQIITSLQTASSGKRLLLGFCFDPASTPEQPIIWATHSGYGFAGMPDWLGAVSRFSGPDLEHVEHSIVNLPRSFNDHATFQPVVGPDGAIYFSNGSNSASGAPDKIWGNRPERMLSASILRLDQRKLTPGTTLDVKTLDGGGTYDPTAPGAPLTIYAGGIRVAYDLVWASNGQLYAAVNGSAAGGNAPAGSGAPALNDIPIAEDDFLHRIIPGKYYGHPNPVQGRFVLNAGNLTKTIDPYEVSEYPVGTRPDPDFIPAVHNFGQHVSANGLVEYRGSAFGGKLDKWLLVCRYNVGNDLTALHVAPDGSIDQAMINISGLSNFTNPLDVCEDVRSGALYVAEYGAQRITLCRPHLVTVTGERQ